MKKGHDKEFSKREQDLVEKIKKEGVMVVRGDALLPIDPDPHLTQDLIISLCLQGSLQVRYDMLPVEFSEHDMTVVMPDHMLARISQTPDYRCVHVLVSRSFFNEIRFRNPYHFHLQYHRTPYIHLNDEQFSLMKHLISVLETATKMQGEKRNEMCAAVLDLIGEFLLEFRRRAGLSPDAQAPSMKLFDRFYEAVAAHYQESHEVQFYANLFCVSPKYFSTVIRQTTGATPSEWIARFVVVKAKLLMRTTDLSMLRISQELGFPDQTSFTRYFKANTGYPPTAYRTKRCE